MSPTKSWHHDDGKPRPTLLPPRALMQVAQVFTFGAEKYGTYNWVEHYDDWDIDDLRASLMRHALYDALEVKDEESGLDHMAHAATCALMILELRYRQNLAHETTDSAREAWGCW